MVWAILHTLEQGTVRSEALEVVLECIGDAQRMRPSREQKRDGKGPQKRSKLGFSDRAPGCLAGSVASTFQKQKTSKATLYDLGPINSYQCHCVQGTPRGDVAQADGTVRPCAPLSCCT